MNGMVEFGGLIRRARRREGLTGPELAMRLGRAHSFVVRLEGGKNSNIPDPQMMTDLSRVLRISKEEMLTALGYLDDEERQEDHRSGPRQAIIDKVDEYHWDDRGAEIAASFVDSAARLYARAERKARPAGEDDFYKPAEPHAEHRIPKEEEG